MPFGYYNVPRSRYLKETIHGMSLIKASWANGYNAAVCNSAKDREPNEWEPDGNKFPGWAGIISPWGKVITFIENEGNNEARVVEELDPTELEDRRPSKFPGKRVETRTLPISFLKSYREGVR